MIVKSEENKTKKARGKKTVRRRTYPMPQRDQIGLSVDETCAITGIGRTNILAAVHSGTLPSRQLGARYIIKRSDAEAYVDSLPAAGVRP